MASAHLGGYLGGRIPESWSALFVNPDVLESKSIPACEGSLTSWSTHRRPASVPRSWNARECSLDRTSILSMGFSIGRAAIGS